MNNLLRYPGSKKRIAPVIISNMPRHRVYVEPFFGSGAVLMEKPPAEIETVNDLDDDVINLFRVIRENPEELIWLIQTTPYAREEYDLSYIGDNASDLERARRFLIQSNQGHGFRVNEKTGWRKDTGGRESAYAIRRWNELPDIIRETAERLKKVQIEHMDAIELIQKYNAPGVLIYADPPYVLSTRGRKQYRHEMTDRDHEELLKVLLNHKGYVMLSGYDTDLYNHTLQGWSKIEIPARAEGGLPRTEVLWMNFVMQMNLKNYMEEWI